MKQLFKKMSKKGKNAEVVSEQVRIEIISFDDKIPKTKDIFMAKEKQDTDGNLIFESPGGNFKEYVSRIVSKPIEELKYKFGIRDMDRDASIKTTKDKIIELESVIKSYNNKTMEKEHPNLFKNIHEINLEDLQTELRMCKVLLFKITHDWDDKGIYVKFDKDGFRHYMYKVEEGVMYPLMFVNSTHKIIPAMDTKRKYLKEDFFDIHSEKMDGMSWTKSLFGKVMMFATIGLIIVLLISITESGKRFDKAVDMINKNKLVLEQIQDDQMLLVIHDGKNLNETLGDEKKVVTMKDRYIGMTEKVIS